MRKAQNIRRRPGCSESLTEPNLTKPKGMHWKTFERLRDKADQAEERMWQGVSSLDEKLKKRGR